MPGSRLRRHALLATLSVALLALAVGTPPAALAASQFRPRVGFALGLEPLAGPVQDVAIGTNTPVAYHGGSVMRDVTIHTVFWAPSGYAFDGSPAPGVLGYEAMIERYFTDVAAASGTTSNVFSILDQYGDASGPGSYQIQYAAASDAVLDTNPYPPASQQCASPGSVATCVTDLEVERQIDGLIGTGDPSARGLSNVWFLFLPPDVDECTSSDVCGTNSFAGYHSEFDLGHGETIYAAIPDPLIELNPPAGSDPEGNPEAESTIDTVTHETIEAITDPDGNAWMDPNGYEVADKCETGPQTGPPLGYAPDGSPYNQLINGHEYLVQDIWSNARGGCVQSSTVTTTSLPPHTIDLRQFSPRVSGNVGAPVRTPVVVALIRAGTLVASARAETGPTGAWGPVTLRDRDGRPHAVGDDRDQIEVEYGFGGAAPDLIETGDGGNPFTESGYTGWFDLDNGYSVRSSGATDTVDLGPCGQTGVLSLQAGLTFTEPPAELCQTETDEAELELGHVGPRAAMTFTSEDNRAESFLAPNGALVKMTIALGEPNSVSAVGNDELSFAPTGFPTCRANLRTETVSCSGLVPGGRYTIGGHRARAGGAGTIAVAGLHLHGGEVLTLVDRAGRRLTSLHVAQLRVAIIGDQTVIASGTCQPGAYWGAPLTSPPASKAVSYGISGSGTICPTSGRANGLPATDIAQTDEFSGGETVTSVPLIESTAPIQDETLYGPFIASAQSGLPGLNGSTTATGVAIALTIKRAGSGHRVFHAADVDTVHGVPVSGLAPGAYTATWVLRDANGDTRTLTTRFAAER
jgi:hypothetical protein